MARVSERATMPGQRLDFRILGPLAVEAEAGPLVLGGRRQRALLALLLLHAGEVVATDRLLDELWGEKPPATAASSLRNLIAQLRKLLGPDTIATRAAGYLLQVERERLDVARFERLVAEAREAYPPQQVALLREALALWRGPPLADLSFERFAQREIRRLEESRLEALEQRLEAELALGQGAELVPELEVLVAEQPLRERPRGQLMLAFYRAGRQAEALEAYQAARRTLVEELGVEPSPMLQELHKAILRQDAALAPAPRSEPTTRLPAQPTPFLGRTTELSEVVALLQRADVRLLTLTGAGGSGKTRLALRAATDVAPDYPHGVFWVPLASLRDPALVRTTIAQALDVKDERELARRIGDGRLLLLLDNCEHLLEAAPDVAELLSACPNLNVFATSREPLHLAGERDYSVPPLREQEAVALFRQRAHVSGPEEAVREICRRVDYLPLAVELAAARTKLLSPEALLQRLEKRLPLLTGGPRDAPERQRTLEATIAWSYDLLTDDEKRLFARLSVFAGGCTLEAAEQVCHADLDTLPSLVDKNLLRHDGDRFWMLETIRELALEKLEPLEDSEQLRRRHADYMFEFLKTSDMAPTDAALAQRMKAESDNLRTAVEWALSRQHADLALSLAGHSYHGPHPAELSRITAREWTGWLDAGLALADRDDSKVYADALIMRAAIHRAFGDDNRAEPLARASLDRFLALGDRVGQSRALLQLGLIAMRRGEHDLARERFEQALELAEAAGSAIDHRHMLHNLGELERAAGNLDRAAALLERALHLARDAGASWHVAMIEHSLGDTALASGDMATAERHYMRALSLARDLGYLRGIEVCFAALASLAAKRGEAEHAGRLWGASEAFQRAVGYELHPLEWHVYEEAIATVAGPRFEQAAKATRNAEPDEALAAALAD